MNKEGFTLQNPAIITTRQFGDGVFNALGNIILGIDHSRNNFLSFNIQPIYKGCFCSLFIWDFDRLHISVNNPKKQILLFSPTGKISANPNKFEVTLIEISDQPLKYFVYGRSPASDESFLYISLIMNDDQTHNFSFSANDSNFDFNPKTSILFNPISIAINCLSTVKIMTFLPSEKVNEKPKLKTIQFDIENYLKTRLQCNIKNVEYYQTSIIDKDENESSFIIFIGFTFYNEKVGKWTAAFIIMNVPVNGKPVRQLHQESVSFEKRPHGDELKETVVKWEKDFLLICNKKIDSRLNVLTNKNKPGVDMNGIRLIKIPEINLIIADERNGIIKF